MEEGSQLVYISLLFCKMAAYGYASTPVCGAAVCCLWIREPQAAYPQASHRTQDGFVCRHIHKMRMPPTRI